MENASKTSKVAESSPSLGDRSSHRLRAPWRVTLFLLVHPPSPIARPFSLLPSPRRCIDAPRTRLHHLLLLLRLLCFILFSWIVSLLILPSSEHTAAVYGDLRRYVLRIAVWRREVKPARIPRLSPLLFSFPPFCPPVSLPYLSRPPVPAVCSSLRLFYYPPKPPVSNRRRVLHLFLEWIHSVELIVFYDRTAELYV